MESAGLDHPVDLAVLGWVLFVALAGHASHRLLRPTVRRDFLPLSIQQHAWLAGIVCLGALWSLRIGAGSALHLSMIGVSLYAIVFGYARALLGAALALIGQNALAQGGWSDLGVTGVLVCALPAAVAGAWQRALAARLPHHLFVFIIGNGMFGTLLAAGAAQLALVGLQLALTPQTGWAPSEAIGYALLLAWGEALTSGMIFSALVIFRPQIVITFAQDEYLPRRR
jgi:uncharacterized membrane protein